MILSKDFQEFVRSDIERISEAITSNQGRDELLKLHKVIDSRYQSCIANWYHGLNEAVHLQGIQSYLDYDYLVNVSDIVQNLEMWKEKLEVYLYGMNANSSSETTTTNVNVTTNVNLNITFEHVRAQIEDMTSLTAEETNEILEKISELEEIINSKDKKKTKWEKVKPVLVWLADKSFDVGMALLPLLLNLQG